MPIIGCPRAISLYPRSPALLSCSIKLFLYEAPIFSESCSISFSLSFSSFLFFGGSLYIFLLALIGDTSLNSLASGSATNFGLASGCFGDSADGGGVGFGITLPDWADAPQNVSSETTEINNKPAVAQTAVPVFIWSPPVFSIANHPIERHSKTRLCHINDRLRSNRDRRAYDQFRSLFNPLRAATL